MAFPSLLSLLFALPTANGALADEDPADLCLTAARLAAVETGVPHDVLIAIALTETGRAGAGGALRPWPWTLNQAGKSHWFASREEALSHLATVVPQGVSNVDIGCFQLNWRWHNQAFPSSDAMLDPGQNALHAARFLASLHAKSGDWTNAVGRYHSATPELAERYLARFTPILLALGAEPPAIGKRPNGFRLLQAGPGATMGSLVPKSGAIRPLVGGS
ncbi:transglycosylase SLT domain-containing protein [Pseudogemmobacter sonorensis]|uniref:transglycosylase SLT domain-containing protein n=1 Tax=Pseudogemmobacter sonorensis TaxID=2989681 RepID=UPI00369B5A41